ncbi:hypothetical protein, partial [Staphylococcus aureus]|uniref:hypothetical protein n=2 Tax=Staphylococcus aureus TaxID=1280 RepID=UPI0020C10378
MNVNDHIKRLEERLLAWDAEIIQLKSELQTEKDKNEAIEKSYSRALKVSRERSRKNELLYGKTVKHLQKARRIKKNMQYSLDLRDSEIQDLTYQILTLEEDARFYEKKIDQLNHENAVLSTDLSVEELRNKHSKNANVKLSKLTEKHISRLRKARAAKKSLNAQLLEVTNKADDLFDRNIKLQEILEETRMNELNLHDETKKPKAKVEALEKENSK